MRLYFGHFGLPEVITAKEEILPRRRRVNHGQGTINLQVQIVTLVQLLNEICDERLIEGNMADIFLV